MADGSTLRVVAYSARASDGDRGAVDDGVRSLAPDIVVARDGPRRLRWRTRSADLARRLGLFHGAGGLPSLGNLVLVSLRVAVRDTWCVRFPLTPGRQMRGAVLAMCSVGRTSFVVAGTHLSTDPCERSAQAAILAKVLSDVDKPLILAGDVGDTLLAQGRVDAAAGMILVGPGVRVTAAHHRRGRRAERGLPVGADLTLPGSDDQGSMVPD